MSETSYNYSYAVPARANSQRVVQNMIYIHKDSQQLDPSTQSKVFEANILTSGDVRRGLTSPLQQQHGPWAGLDMMLISLIPSSVHINDRVAWVWSAVLAPTVYQPLKWNGLLHIHTPEWYQISTKNNMACIIAIHHGWYPFLDGLPIYSTRPCPQPCLSYAPIVW
jgi:hypothetical protein